MSNQSQSTSEIPFLDQLLDSLGFDPWKILIASFVIPIISLKGIFLCFLSVWIFFQKSFKDPVFFYYRLLCIVYIVHLLHNIPRGLLNSPRYFSKMDTYFSSVFLIYYTSMSYFLFHFEETLQMAILLTRMKIFSPFVKKHFSAKPWHISVAFFLTCLFIDTPFSTLSFQVSSFGTYSYYDPSTHSAQIATFYYFSSSKFSLTLSGRIILAFTVPFLNLFLSIIAGISLNIISVYKYRSYVSDRREKNEDYTRDAYNRNQNDNHVNTGVDEIEVVVFTEPARPKKWTEKEINENKAEKNMLYMALTLCSISILARLLLICVYIFFLYFNSFFYSLILIIITLSMYTLVATSAILVFYSFNKMFREEFQKRFFTKKTLDPNQ